MVRVSIHQNHTVGETDATKIRTEHVSDHDFPTVEEAMEWAQERDPRILDWGDTSIGFMSVMEGEWVDWPLNYEIAGVDEEGEIREIESGDYRDREDESEN
jgi:hypothetical protein